MVISQRLGNEKMRHEAFTLEQSKKMDLEMASLKDFVGQVNEYIN
jgi:hypothetical protein